MAKKMISVEVAYLSKLTRRVRDLEQENDKLISHMKVISEAARESQTRSRFYSKREEPPANKRIQRRNGKSLSRGNSRQVLRGKQTVPVGGVQVSIKNSTPHQLALSKITSQTKRVTGQMVKKGSR